jgi:long-subunit fatty acid transport protein
VQVIERIRTSSDINPQWLMSQLNAINQAGAVAMQQMQQLQRSESAMLNQQMSANNASLNAQHQATMDMLDQKAASNRANYQYQQAAKAVNHENEMLYIKDQHLEYYRPTGTVYAVPNY